MRASRLELHRSPLKTRVEQVGECASEFVVELLD
jgi:hypothetical protein